MRGEVSQPGECQDWNPSELQPRQGQVSGWGARAGLGSTSVEICLWLL